MKKILLVIAAIIAGTVLFGSIGPLLGLAICVAIAYFSYRQFMKSNETASKVLWGIVGVIGLFGAISNVPALIGVVAIIALYYIYKSWNKGKNDKIDNLDDPFTNFEREWENLKKTL